MAQMTMVKALNLALREALAEDKKTMIIGEDVGQDEGVFRVTEDLLKEFGPDRVVDTPVAESAIVGLALGLAFNGFRPICEMQFSGFGYCGFAQIENHLSRYRNRTRGRFTAPVVIRMPYGGGIRAIEHHSESREAFFAQMPGLKLVIPSGPRNARALLRASILDPDPVMFYEPKACYRAFREEVPDEPETLPIGKAQVVRAGSDVTLISYGASMRPTLEAVTTKLTSLPLFACPVEPHVRRQPAQFREVALSVETPVWRIVKLSHAEYSSILRIASYPGL